MIFVWKKSLNFNKFLYSIFFVNNFITELYEKWINLKFQISLSFVYWFVFKFFHLSKRIKNLFMVILNLFSHLKHLAITYFNILDFICVIIVSN